MPSLKRLSSVCHSLAHHAASSLSYVHPHLGEATEKAGKSAVEVDVLATRVVPEGLGAAKPLELSLSALKQRFLTILASEHFEPSGLAAARLFFEFREDFSDYWPTRVSAVVQSLSGRPHIHAVNLMGDSVSPPEAWASQWAVAR